jgi:DNA-binding LacI/PurR family transcriptional regulator
LEEALVTIAEVAREAGVGVGTVSRVINGSAAVRDDTRRRVLDAVDRLGYTPNAAARALSTGRTNRIGVVAPFFTSASVIERLRGVTQVLAGADRQLILFDVEHPEQARACFDALAGGGSVDGVLSISLCPSAAEIARFSAAGAPVVLVDHGHPTLPSITIDDVAGGRLATEHLLALGHERIAFVGDEEHTPYGFSSSAARRAGYECALRDAGLEPEPELIARTAPGRVAAGRAALLLLDLEEPPTAVFAASDDQALGVLDAAAEASLPVPEALSVVGFDDVEIARWAGLTTVAQPLEESGAKGAELVLAAVEGTPVRSCRLELELVRRMSAAEPGTMPGRPTVAGGSFVNRPWTRGAECPSVLQY